MLQLTRAGFLPTIASMVCASTILHLPHQESMLSPGFVLSDAVFIILTSERIPDIGAFIAFQLTSRAKSGFLRHPRLQAIRLEERQVQRASHRLPFVPPKR